MTATRRPLIAGNWKMNGRRAALDEVLAVAAGAPALAARADLLLCPPATLLAAAAEAARGTGLHLGAQDLHPEDEGARTGDLAGALLRDAGAAYVIVGHSERRQPCAEGGHGEPDALVRAKARAARAAGLVPVICVGETLGEREAGRALAVVEAQVAASVPGGAEHAPGAALVVAYEPVWAIGTGRTPTPEDIAAMHAGLRAALARLLGFDAATGARLLYGGSVKPSNAGAILALPDVDGALVGGASLKAADFLAIAGATAG